MKEKRKYETWIYVFQVMVVGETQLKNISIESDKKLRAIMKVKQILGDRLVNMYPPLKIKKFSGDDPMRLGVLY